MSARSGAMELEQRHLEQIGEYVKSHFAEWMDKAVPAQSRTDPLLLERMVRVEEELKAQRELMQQGFDAINKRFGAVDKRFESVDKRFESVDKRFESVDKRFEDLIHYMDKRFEAVDKRFVTMDKRFESIDRKLESLNRSLRTFIYSSFSFTAAAAGVIIAVIKLT